MTGPAGDPVTGALRTLAGQDLEVARLAEAALDSLTFGEGLAGITQHGLQEWLWYQLPVKWLTDPEEHLALARALGRLLELLDRPRYAAVWPVRPDGADPRRVRGPCVRRPGRLPTRRRRLRGGTTRAR